MEEPHEVGEYPLPHTKVKLVHEVWREHLIEVEGRIDFGETNGEGALRRAKTCQMTNSDTLRRRRSPRTCIGVSDLLSSTRLSR